jgi:hypothetical protein
MQIEMDEKTAKTLERLSAQAAAQRLPLNAYLEQFIQADDHAAAQHRVSLAEFDKILDELAARPGGAPILPADFSRADIYADHD